MTEIDPSDQLTTKGYTKLIDYMKVEGHFLLPG